MAKRGRKPQRKPKSVGPIEIPAGLDEASQSEFVRLAEKLKSRDILDQADTRLIEAAARTIVLLDRAYAELGSGALTLKAGDGTPVAHPMLKVINPLTMRLRGLLNDLGLTPKTSKLGSAPEQTEEESWEGLLNVAG